MRLADEGHQRQAATGHWHKCRAWGCLGLATGGGSIAVDKLATRNGALRLSVTDPPRTK